MISVKSPEEIKILKEGGVKLASVMKQVVNDAKPGVEAEDLNQLAIKLIKEQGGEPSFLGYKSSTEDVSYPSALCVSVNNEVVHGLPVGKVLKNGNIVGLDLGMKYKGLYTDMSVTVGIGKIDEKAKKIMDVAKIALEKGVAAVKQDAHIGDIGEAIQSYVESRGFSVVRALVGHGVGYGVHEAPEIPNFGKAGIGPKLTEGMILALEPMITAGNSNVILDSDGFTWKTRDNSLSAHFEHTVVVHKNSSEILTKI